MAGDPYWNNVVLGVHAELGANDDPYFDSVQFLSHFDGANGATTFTDESAYRRTVSRAVNAVLDSASAKFGSTALNPVAGGVSVTPSAGLFPTTAPFTVEAWVNLTTTIYDCVAFQLQSDASVGGILLYHSAGSFYGYVSDSNAASWEVIAPGPSAIASGTWAHVAFVRDSSNNFRLYVNGVSGTTVNWAGTIHFGSAPKIAVGVNANLTGASFSGFIDEARVTFGVCRYIANFTPPTLPFSLNNTVADVKGHALAALGNARATTIESKFGIGALSVGGNGVGTANKIEGPISNDWILGGAPFTIEFQIYINARPSSNQGDILSATGGVFAFSGTTGMHYYIFADPSGVAMQWWTGSTGAGISIPVGLNAWHHVALTYDGSGLMLGFCDGVQNAGTASACNPPSATPKLVIGSYDGKADTSTYAFNGFIDDIRITKGVRRYAVTFTPPAATFPDYQLVTGDSNWNNVVFASHFDPIGPIDPNRSNVVFASHFDGANNATTVVDTCGSNITLYNGAKLSTTQKKFGTTSFDLTSAYAYADTTETALFDFTGPFTIESWVYLNESPSTWATVISKYHDSSTTGYRIIIAPAGTQWQFSYADSAGTVQGVGGGSVAINQWVHLEVGYDGTNLYLFTNGFLNTTVASLPPKVNGSAMRPIFGSTNSGAWYLHGYLDDLRVTRGVVRHTDSFTPATTQFADGTQFIDLKGHAVTPIGNPLITTSQKKFGEGALALNGSSQYLSIPASVDWSFGTGDFTIEAWVYRAVAGVTHRIVAHRVSTDGNNLVTFGVRNDDKLAIATYVGGAVVTNIMSVATIPALTWVHVAVTRVAGVVKLWVNGANNDTVTTNLASAYPNLATPLVIGRGHSDISGEEFNGYIDDLRITKGVGRYSVYFGKFDIAFSDGQPLISGTVRDSAGELASRLVRAYRRSDGALAGSAVSNAASGEYFIPALDSTPHFVVVHDTLAVLNALIVDSVTPV